MSDADSKLGETGERVLRRLRLRLLLASGLDHLLQFSALALVIGGIAVLLVRRLAPAFGSALPTLALILGLIALGGAVLRAWMRRLSRDDLLAWADRRAGAGGLLLTVDEHDDPRWRPLAEARLQEIEPPRLQFHERSRLLLPAFVFCALTLLVPTAAADLPPLVDAGERFTKKLEDRIERMAEENLLDEKDREAMQREIENLRRDLAREGLGARQWEALDALRRRLDQNLDARARSMARAARAGREAARPRNEAGRDRDSAARSAEEFAESLRGLDPGRLMERLPEGLDEDLLRRLAESAAGMELDADALAGLDPADLEAALAALGSWLEGEADLLAALGGNEEGLADLRAALEGRPGRGGINRGRADARLDFAGETPEHKGRFLLERLRPKTRGGDPGELLSMKTREGEEGPDASARRGAARDFSDTEQDLVGKRRVLPRHRGVVKRFFDGREATTPAAPDDEKK